MTSKERIKAIEKKQAALAAKIKQAQEALYRLLLESIDRIEKDPAYVEQVFKKYQESAGMKLVTTIASDVAAISGYNYAYFLSFKDELNLSGKDFTKIKGTVDTFIQERIGLKGNKVVAESFLDTLLTDATVKQKVKQQAYTSLLAGDGANAFRTNIKSLVLGEGEKLGALEAHYNTFVYDTYNQVDSALQEQYSEELELTAFVYEGGLISTSRAFCRSKNGRLYLKEEAIKEWPDELKVAKPPNYQPLIHRGGYSCRHSLNYVSNRRAIRLRDDLEIGPDGKLRVKGSGGGEAFPAPTEFKNWPSEINPKLWETMGDDVEVNLVTDKSDKAFYLPDSKTLTIGTGKRFKDSGYYQSSVVYHEYGHAIHTQKNIVDKWGRVAPDFDEVFKKSQATLDGTLMKMQIDKRCLNLLQKSALPSTVVDEATEALYSKLIAKHNRKDIEVMAGATADTLQALTNGRFGFGHPKGYYKNAGFDRMEFFAHASESYFGTNPVMEALMPDVHKYMLDYMETVANKTHGTVKK